MSGWDAVSDALRHAALRVLGLEDGASEETIRSAYRRIALDCHPDRRPIDPQCLERFRLASEAYEILTRFRPDGHYHIAASVGEAAQSEGHPSEAPEGSYARWWWEQYKDLFV